MPITNAEIKNKVLQFLIDNKGGWGIETIYEKLSKPTKTISHFKELIDEMIVTGEKYFDYQEVNMHILLSKNDFTQEYLDDSGFKKASLVAAAQTKALVHEIQQEKKIKELQLENLELSNRLANTKLKTHWIPIIISCLGLGIAVISILRPFDKVSKKQLDSNEERMKNQIEQLRNDFKKENDLLKDRLYKAELMVRVLEEG